MNPSPSLLTCLALLLPAPAFAVLKAGFAERDITPEIGMERPGGYGKVFHKAIHDPCKVRAAVFDDGRRKVAIVGIDALILRRPQVVAVREQVHARCGIDPGAILIGASHSHSSGPVGLILPGEFDHADAAIRQLAYEKSSNADPVYLELVEKQLVEAIVAADAARREVELGFGSGNAEGVSFNRRFRMKNGLSYTHPGYGNPEMLEPAGPVDTEVGVIGAWTPEGELTGCIVTFACHATTSPPGASANYIYYLEKTLREATGSPDLPVVFVNGASGDITQVDNRNPWGRRSGEEAAEVVGGSIGAEALKVLLSLRKITTVPVDQRVETLRIARRPPSAEHLASSREIVKTLPEPGIRATQWIFAKEIVLLDALIAVEPVREVEIQAVQIGPAVFVTTPAEYFCQFGLDQKAAIDFPFTWPVSLANGCVGYVPTAEAFAEHGGGYETRLTSYSNLIPSAGRTMADAGIALALSLDPGPLPKPAKLPPARPPWDYGSTGPQLE
ncbi:MAG: hypothetical protein ACC661_07790 [Verrucomicrobiales bacterium]